MRIWPALTLAVLAGPVLAGLAGTVIPAFGHLPVVGLTGPSLAPFATLFATPGIWRASALSLGVGLGSTLLALAVVVLFTAGWSGTRVFARMQRALSPLLSVPHAAAAIGLAALIAPSGWLARLVSPWATGWIRPPDLLIPADPWGVTMAAGLVVKEVPFLLLMTLAALAQSRETPARRIAGSLGYGRIAGWLLTVFPALYAQIRLPVFAVLAFAMSVVDLAIILGPTTPPPLSVLIVRWMGEPDLSRRTIAAAGALWQLALVGGALALWLGLERTVAALATRWTLKGTRLPRDGVLRAFGLLAGLVCVAAVVAGLVALMLWSVAGPWRFPDPWPTELSARAWVRAGHSLTTPLAQTFAVAVLATALALILAIGSLQARARAQWAIYLPLILPQTAFLPGLQVFLLMLGADRGMAPVVLAHLTFVLPYVLLSLAGPWRAWDTRLATQAAALGAHPARVFWCLRLPMMLRPVLTAAAIGLAVSVGQYLPTLLIGGGRVATLTTEAVALAAGGDRRAMAVTGLAQTAAALLPFALALALPALVWRNRKGMLHG